MLSKHLYRAIGMPDLNVAVGEVELDLVVLETVDLDGGEEYIDVVGKSDLVNCFFLEVIEYGLIGKGLNRRGITCLISPFLK